MTIRYGEILLIYAEALNELTSGQVYHLTTYTGADVEIQRSVDEMRYAIKRIRMRAGVPDYSEETYNNPNDFRVKLKRERQIELLGENSMRYFDLRRWKDGNGPPGRRQCRPRVSPWPDSPRTAGATLV